MADVVRLEVEDGVGTIRLDRPPMNAIDTEVTRGLAATGKTITAAAAIMVLVFASFILGGERVIELFGLGLAGAVLLDALVVRSVLVPGLMLLAGKANWWLPPSLDRLLPHLNVEGSAHQSDSPRPARHPSLALTAQPLLQDRAG